MTDGYTIYVPEHLWTRDLFDVYMFWLRERDIFRETVWFRPVETHGPELVRFIFKDSEDAVAFRLAHGL